MLLGWKRESISRSQQCGIWCKAEPRTQLSAHLNGLDVPERGEGWPCSNVRSRSDSFCLQLLRHIFFGKPTPKGSICPIAASLPDARPFREFVQHRRTHGYWQVGLWQGFSGPSHGPWRTRESLPKRKVRVADDPPRTLFFASYSPVSES
jgi:hypothetical protein